MSTFAVTNPNTGEVEQTFDSLTTEEIAGVIDTADRAFQDWKETPVSKRGEVLKAFADLVEGRASELADLIGKEMGKPKKQGEAEVKKVAFTARWFADNSEKFLEDTQLPDAQGADQTYVKHDPLGVLLGKGLGLAFLLNILLTLLGYIPGLIHAFWVQSRD